MNDNLSGTSTDGLQSLEWQKLDEQLVGVPSIIEAMKCLDEMADRLQIAGWRDLQKNLTKIPSIAKRTRQYVELADKRQITAWWDIQQRVNTLPSIVDSMIRLNELSGDLHMIAPDSIKWLSKASLVAVGAFMANTYFDDVEYPEVTRVATMLPTAVESLCARMADDFEKARAFVASLELIFTTLEMCDVTQFLERDNKTSLRQTIRLVKASIAHRPLIHSNPEKFRIVCTRVLPVRLTQKDKSQVIGKIAAGQIVLLVEKRSGRCAVRWYSSEIGNVIQGWTRSKYLALASRQR